MVFGTLTIDTKVSLMEFDETIGRTMEWFQWIVKLHNRPIDIVTYWAVLGELNMQLRIRSELILHLVELASDKLSKVFSHLIGPGLSHLLHRSETKIKIRPK